jgi:hypothetical protein
VKPLTTGLLFPSRVIGGEQKGKPQRHKEHKDLKFFVFFVFFASL